MLPDFTSVNAATIKDRTSAAIEQAEAIVDELVSVAGPRTWDNTLGPLARVGEIVTDADGSGPFMARVHPEADVRAAGVEWEEKLTKWNSDLVFREDVAAAINEYAETDEAAGLTGTRRRFLEHWQRDLRRAGHDLDEADRNRLRDLRTRLIELQVAFSANLDEFDDHIDMSTDDLAGMSDDYISRLGAGEEAGTYRVTMAYPDYLPFIRQAKSRELRRRLQFKFWNQAADTNQDLLAEAVSLRQQMAALLGYSSWADHSMDVKMAEGPEAVAAFYDSIVPGLEAKAAAEKAALQARLDADHPGETLQPWDLWYYDNEQRMQDHGIDPDEVAAYFSLEAVVDGMFAITGDVFGLDYRQVEDTRAWHPDVFLYEIRDRATDEPIAYFWADLFPREGKYGHAAAFSIVYGRQEDDGYRLPVAAMVANFTKPTETAPSLLKHDEALTLFHEFGHILHQCLSKVDLERFSGFDTEWDFVEAPSQIMENWMWIPEVLQRFAKHHESGEPIPDELVERLVAARDLNIGLFTLRQVFLGQMDLDLHIGDEAKDLDQVYRNAFALTQMPFHEDTHFLAGFGHMMGGYDAGYYGYLWSMVYGDDMFSIFEDEGVLDPGVGMRYRNEVLATGGSRDALEHLRAFLGREPSSKAFLKKLGLGSN